MDRTQAAEEPRTEIVMDGIKMTVDIHFGSQVD